MGKLITEIIKASSWRPNSSKESLQNAVSTVISLEEKRMDVRPDGYNSTGFWGVERKGLQKNSSSEVVSLMEKSDTQWGRYPLKVWS